MQGVTFQEILRLLGPQTGQLGWNILLYLIFFFGLLTLFTIPDKNMTASLLMGAVVIAAVVAKLSTSASPPLLKKNDFFGMFLVNVILFIFPILTAGIIRARKKARPVTFAILTAVFGGAFFFFYWFIEQSGMV